MVIAVLVATSAACTRPNPNVCCVTEAQCTDLGADELRPCAVGQACAADNTCVAAECTTSADCDPAAPICRRGLCEATCATEEDCAGVVGRPHCAPDGACVACADSSQCTGTTNICDAEERTCRGCERDDECASGVCLEADGVCAEEAEVAYVAPASGVNDTCTRQSPCSTLDFAFTKFRTGGPHIAHVMGGSARMGSHVVGGRSMIIDGTNTTLQVAPQAFDFSTPAGVTMMNVTLSLETASAISVPAGASVRLYNVTLAVAVDEGLRSTGGALEITRSRVSGDARVGCTMLGRVVVSRSEFEQARLVSNACSFTVSRTRFTNSSGMIGAAGGQILIENNVFIQTSEFGDSLQLGSGPGSYFRFNTIVNTAAGAFDPVALFADDSITVTSNVFAYNSPNPIEGGATITDSLFDSVGSPDAGANMTAPRSEIFVDFAGGDYRPRATSAALEGGAPNLVTVDFEGNPRPQPIGSRPDIGAYEAP